MADLNPILQAAQAAQSTISSSSAGIISARNAQADLANSQADAQTAIGLNNAIVLNAQNSAALATQNAKLKAGAIFGADLSQQGEQLTEATQVWNTAYQQQLSAAQAIQEKDSVSFLSDPLQYVINQFTVNDDIRAHNAAMQVKDTAKAHIDEINAMSDATARNQINFSQSITQASIDAAAQTALKTAQIAADKAKSEGLSYNIEGLQTAINASKEDLAIKYNVLNAQTQQQNLQLALDNYSLHKQEFEWKKADRATQEAADEMIVSRMQKGLVSMYGATAPDLQNNPKAAKQYLGLLKSNTPAGKEAVEAFMLGGSGTFGSPAGVVDLLKSGVNIKFNPSQEAIRSTMETATTELAGKIASGKVAKPSNAQESQAALNAEIRAKLDIMAKNIDPGSSSNVFNIGSTAALISLPGVRDTALVKTVLGPAVTAGAKLSDPTQLVSATVAAVNQGKIKLNDAIEGITTLYQKGVETNLQERDFTKFGISPPRTYNTSIQTNKTALFGGTEIVNLTDTNSVRRAVLKMMSTSRLSGAVISPTAGITFAEE